MVVSPIVKLHYNERTCFLSKGIIVAENIDLSRFLNKAAGQAKEERIEIPLVLENVLRYCLKDAQERMQKGEDIVPFSALAVKETLFMEEHPGDDVKECFDSAKRTVENARGASAYGFCYDGYIEVGDNATMRDCLIAEGGCPGEPYGHAIGVPYTAKSDGTIEFADEPIYVGSAMNYMLSLSALYDDEETVEETDQAGEEAAE